MTYQKLRDIAERENIKIYEDCDIGRLKGLYFDNTILLSQNIENNQEKKCILGEELGHHYESYGNILDQEDHFNRAQEIRARRWAYKKLVKIEHLIEAFYDGIRNIFELAEYLEVTTKFLKDAIKYYKQEYGIYHHHQNFIIRFEPFRVLERR